MRIWLFATILAVLNRRASAETCGAGTDECAAGTYCIESASICSPCSFGTMKEGSGNAACIPCPKGYRCNGYGTGGGANPKKACAQGSYEELEGEGTAGG